MVSGLSSTRPKAPSSSRISSLSSVVTVRFTSGPNWAWSQGFRWGPRSSGSLWVTKWMRRPRRSWSAHGFGGAGVWVPFVDAGWVEDAVEDDGRRLFAVGVEDVGPGGDLVRVEWLAGDLQNGLADPGARIPDGGVYVEAEGWLQGLASSAMGMASVRPDAGSMTA